MSETLHIFLTSKVCITLVIIKRWRVRNRSHIGLIKILAACHTQGVPMGNRYREPRPLSPERLSLKSIDSVKHEDYAIEVQATFLFDPYTPDWEGELSRAVVVLSKVIIDGAERAERKRERKSREEYAGIGHNATENDIDVTQP